MSIHPSLVLSEKDKMSRSVLKRTERIRQMHEKGKWKEGDLGYGLPEDKGLEDKIKKETAKAETTAEGAAPAAAGAAPAGSGL
jgi:small basic protein (TIGR04137 family)